MGKVVDLASHKASQKARCTSRSASRTHQKGAGDSEEQEAHLDAWVSQAVLTGLARAYVRKAADIARRLENCDDSIAWMLDDIDELLDSSRTESPDKEIHSVQ